MCGDVPWSAMMFNVSYHSSDVRRRANGQMDNQMMPSTGIGAPAADLGVPGTAVAEAVVARSDSDQATFRLAEGDCFAPLAMTVKRRCNSPPCP